MAFIKPKNMWTDDDPFATSKPNGNDEEFKLLQWPIKLWKISVTAPFFHGAHLLVAADCVGFAYDKLHEKIKEGRIPLICCPETDFDITTKLAKIIEINEIRSVTVVRMDSRCCDDLVGMVQEAIKISRKPLPLQTTTIIIDAEEVD